MKCELIVEHTRHVRSALAVLAIFGVASAAWAQTPAPSADKAATKAPPAPMATQPMPMGKKDSTMNAMPGMGAGSSDMRGSMMDMMKNMESMKMTGDTDQDFAAMMKMHHQGAIDMAQQELKNGKDAKLKTMAKRIIAAQQKEMKEFDQWLNQHK